ncbi:hypothetical protein BG261_02970 [Floricoccus tropicus]|uniref:DUF4145 domain-containing protein n=1 Tax=Floricoccus tropicus TaxID=1859473 RepID=A0A1E8GN20_9LACT|nr:DUF4145 domain-containing protein [Floricoccus tropicus]OFI49557.1 hypothetical protein BG261_02970 [Floricoccus tropicus]
MLQSYEIKLGLYKDVICVDVKETCPFCNLGIKPIHVTSTTFENIDKKTAFLLLNQCPSCKHHWSDEYLIIEPNGNGTYTGYLTNPKLFLPIPDEITEEITKVSPEGVKIYTQALQAEQLGFDSLVGIGMRKSIEFFIKDFLIYTNPENKEKFEKIQLGDAIKNYIDNEDLKALATSSNWLANDETHYVKKFTDKDINDLKKYMKSLIKYIDFQITILGAHELTNSKNT